MAEIINNAVIITCYKCLGEGEITDKESWGPTSRITIHKCEKCNGSGSLWQATTITITPYVPNEKYYKPI